MDGTNDVEGAYRRLAATILLRAVKAVEQDRDQVLALEAWVWMMTEGISLAEMLGIASERVRTWLLANRGTMTDWETMMVGIVGDDAA